MKNGSKDDFFGIWADKKQDIHAYMRDKGEGFRMDLVEVGKET